MAIVINGSTNVIGGVAVGGLPDGIVDTDMLAANAVTAAKATGSAKGITMVDQWRITTSLSTSSSTLIYNWERNDTQSTLIGAGMSTNAGNWTFPSTGLYYIEYGGDGYNNVATRYVGGSIDHSTNSGSNYAALVEAFNSSGQDDASYASFYMASFLDVTNVSTQRVRFIVSSENSITFNGHSSINRTYATFIRLGDT